MEGTYSMTKRFIQTPSLSSPSASGNLYVAKSANLVYFRRFQAILDNPTFLSCNSSNSAQRYQVIQLIQLIQEYFVILDAILGLASLVWIVSWRRYPKRFIITLFLIAIKREYCLSLESSLFKFDRYLGKLNIAFAGFRHRALCALGCLDPQLAFPFVIYSNSPFRDQLGSKQLGWAL